MTLCYELTWTVIVSFTDQHTITVDTTDTEDEDLPQISLQEMLDDLHIADDPVGYEDQQRTY